MNKLSALIGLGLIWIWAFSVPAFAYQEDYFTPQGVWNATLRIQSISQTSKAKSTDKNDLLVLLIPKKTDREQVTGTIEREFTHQHLALQYGITDQWNVLLTAKRTSVKQTGNLSTASTASTASTEQSLQTFLTSYLSKKNISAVGDVELQVLNRFVFDRSHSSIWHIGYLHASAQPDIYYGRHTLNSGSISSYVNAGIGYTYYPSSYAGRVFFHTKAGYAMNTSLKTSDSLQKAQKVREGNRVALSMLWQRKLAFLNWELGTNFNYTAQSSMGGKAQGDATSVFQFVMGVGLGNFVLLENGPQPFPFQFMFRVKPTSSAKRHPDGTPISLEFSTFF